jgi:hypothetical protein
MHAIRSEVLFDGERFRFGGGTLVLDGRFIVGVGRPTQSRLCRHSGDHNHQSGDSPHGDCLYQPFLEHHPTVVHRDRLETCDHLGCRYGVGDSPRACDCRSDVSESLSHDPMIQQTRRLG